MANSFALTDAQLHELVNLPDDTAVHRYLITNKTALKIPAEVIKLLDPVVAAVDAAGKAIAEEGIKDSKEASKVAERGIKKVKERIKEEEKEGASTWRWVRPKDAPHIKEMLDWLTEFETIIAGKGQRISLENARLVRRLSLAENHANQELMALIASTQALKDSLGKLHRALLTNPAKAREEELAKLGDIQTTEKSALWKQIEEIIYQWDPVTKHMKRCISLSRIIRMGAL
jgi:hypothetical protein